MRVYLEIAVKSFQRHLAYRAANVAGILTNTFFGAIYAFVYIALFRNRDAIGGMDVRDSLTYVVITQSLLMAMSAFGNRELSEAIIKGEIAADLVRPVDFYFYWASIDLGRAVYYLLLRGLPTFGIGWLLFRVRLPADLGALGLFLLAVCAGMMLSFAFRFIINSLAFWTTDARGINYLTNTLIMFFSGFMVPLNFLPGGLRAVMEWLPFRALAHLPVSIYLGKEAGPPLWGALALQGVWLALLVLVGRVVLSRMVRRLAVHGG